jgi:hypothetical protein
LRLSFLRTVMRIGAGRFQSTSKNPKLAVRSVLDHSSLPSPTEER